MWRPRMIVIYVSDKVCLGRETETSDFKAETENRTGISKNEKKWKPTSKTDTVSVLSYYMVCDQFIC